jgi:hypothetical protein
MAERPDQPSWAKSYATPVIDQDEEDKKRKEQEEQFMKDVEAAWGVGAPGCSHDHRAEQRIFDLTEEQKQASCNYLLQCGHSYLRECQWGLAVDRYRLCMVYTEYAFPEGEAGQAGREGTRVRAMLGTATAQAHMKPYVDWHAVLDGCQQVLGSLSLPHDLRPVEECTTRARTWLLQAQAHTAKGDYDRALAAADRADACSCGSPAPCSPVIHEEVSWARARVGELQSKYDAESSAQARRMLQGGKAGPAPDAVETEADSGTAPPPRHGTTAHLLSL